MKLQILFLIACTLGSSLGARNTLAQEPQAELWQTLSSRTPWVFLGDSNTYAGGYVAILDAWLHANGQGPKLLNLGVSSETASGLSEVDHPFKRPCVHERLDKVLTMTKPGVVFICYGMNDGIYQPPNPQNLAEFRTGMLELAAEVRAAGAMLVCLTPPIFEAEPVAAKGKLGPTETGRYVYYAPAENYDDTLAQQADWCLSNEMGADAVIDLRAPLISVKQEMRSKSADFNYTQDGVHFGSEASEVVARVLVASLGAPSALASAYPAKEQVGQATDRMKLLRDAYLSATGKNRPGLPAGLPVWLAEQQAKR